MDLVADLTLVLIAALAGGVLAQRAGQPLIVGYILAGVIVGPFTGGVSVGHVEDIERLAELGVVLLLFSLGLEVSFRELAPVRVVALGGAAIQIVLTIALGFAIATGLGWSWQHALWFGALISLSSTMVVLKTLQAQGRLGTLSGRVMLGLLVVQDLAVVPLMIILPELSNPGGGVIRVIIATVRAMALLGVIVLISTRVVPRLMRVIAGWNSRELFLLSTTAVALGVAYATWWFGLSLALGAFIAGLVINESEYAHQALSDVIPLRDVFGMIFFVSVGMLLDPVLLWQSIGVLAIVVLAVAIGKAAILAGVTRAFGYRHVVPIAVALTLFQVGEFAFVLARVGRSSGAIDEELYALVLNTALATIAFTPAVSAMTPWFYNRFARRSPKVLDAITIQQSGLVDHVVVAGAGRVGRSVAEALSHLSLPCILIDLDDRRVQQARGAALPIVYGDATQPVVLEAAGVAHARALLITVPTFPDVRAIVRTARQVKADLPIIARADGPDAVRGLYELGIEEVTSPEFEAAIEMTTQALLRFGVPSHEIFQIARTIRREQYRPPGDGGLSEFDGMIRMSQLARELDLAWVRLPADSPFNGHTLGELQIRSRLGASVVCLVREGTLHANPDSGEKLVASDVVGVLGTRDQIARFERTMRGQPQQADSAL